jgi:hypothetical protein
MGTTSSTKPPLCRVAYRGDSMCGTFRAGDCLWVEPVAFDALETGDVVAIKAEGKAIAHRIAGKGAGGFLTHGVLRADRELLRADRLMGKIVLRERGGNILRVAGGPAGRLRAMALHTKCRLMTGLIFPLAPLYRWLRARGWMCRIWKPRVCTARFAGAGGDITKYIHRGRTVACWAAGEGRWTCRKPYDLVLGPPVP